MAKDSTSSSTIWRTVVFAGAMLGTPTLAAAQAPAGAPAQTKTGAPAMPVRDPAMAKQDQIKSLDAERTALLGKIADTDVKELDKLKKDIVAKDAAIKKAVDELMALRKPRPRTPVVNKPVGRGFVLA